MKRIIRRGEIYLSNFEDTYKVGLPGIRPVIVVSTDEFNRYSDHVFIVHITAPPLTHEYPSYFVRLDVDYATGVNQHSFVRVDRLVSLDSSLLGSKLGMVSRECLRNIGEAILTVISVSSNPSIPKENKIVFKINQKLDFEEDYLHEFKEVTSEKPVDRIVKEFGKYATAFLNEHGGRILWGINDRGVVKGVRLFQEQKDDLRKKIYQVLGTITPPVTPTSFDINFYPVVNDEGTTEDLYVFEVVIPFPLNQETTYFLKGSELWVKLNGVINLLTGPAIQDYILRKHGRK